MAYLDGKREGYDVRCIYICKKKKKDKNVYYTFMKWI